VERRPSGRVAAESEDEAAVTGYPQRTVVQAYPGSGGRRPEDEAALDRVSVKRDASGAGGAGAERQDQRQRQRESGYDAASPAAGSRAPTSIARRVAASAFRYAS